MSKCRGPTKGEHCALRDLGVSIVGEARERIKRSHVGVADVQQRDRQRDGAPASRSAALLMQGAPQVPERG